MQRLVLARSALTAQRLSQPAQVATPLLLAQKRRTEQGPTASRSSQPPGAPVHAATQAAAVAARTVWSKTHGYAPPALPCRRSSRAIRIRAPASGEFEFAHAVHRCCLRRSRAATDQRPLAGLWSEAGLNPKGAAMGRSLTGSLDQRMGLICKLDPSPRSMRRP